MSLFSLASLEEKGEKLSDEVGSAHCFSVTRIAGDDNLVKYYTSFATYRHFQALISFLLNCFADLKMWHGSKTGKLWQILVPAHPLEDSFHCSAILTLYMRKPPSGCTLKNYEYHTPASIPWAAAVPFSL